MTKSCIQIKLECGVLISYKCLTVELANYIPNFTLITLQNRPKFWAGFDHNCLIWLSKAGPLSKNKEKKICSKKLVLFLNAKWSVIEQNSVTLHAIYIVLTG